MKSSILRNPVLTSALVILALAPSLAHAEPDAVMVALAGGGSHARADEGTRNLAMPDPNHFEAGFGLLEGQGAGANGSFNLRLMPNTVAALKDVDDTSIAVDARVGSGVELNGSVQTLQLKEPGSVTVPKYSGRVRLLGAASVGGASSVGSGHAAAEQFYGAQFDADRSMDRVWDANIHYGGAFETALNGGKFNWGGELDLGISRMRDRREGNQTKKHIPYLQLRINFDLERCLHAGVKNAFCVEAVAAGAIGLLRAEASGEANVSYQRRIAGNRGKFYLEAGGSGAASVDMAGPHTSYTAGGAAGVKY